LYPQILPVSRTIGKQAITSGLPTIHSEQLNWACYARNSKSPNFHEHFHQERPT
jgi:hypothetical protein